MTTLHNVEDKHWWFQHGVMLEHQFVSMCNDHLSMNACINPDKEFNPTVPDLIVDGRLSDLKSQNTPFFTASRYGIDPRYAVTFNRKDFDYYWRMYPSIVIFFWIDWKTTRWNDRSVEYHGGVYRAAFPEIVRLIENGAPEHTYRNRVDDKQGNAKSSFILDVRCFDLIFDAGEHRSRR